MSVRLTTCWVLMTFCNKFYSFAWIEATGFWSGPHFLIIFRTTNIPFAVIHILKSHTKWNNQCSSKSDKSSSYKKKRRFNSARIISVDLERFHYDQCLSVPNRFMLKWIIEIRAIAYSLAIISNFIIIYFDVQIYV